MNISPLDSTIFSKYLSDSELGNLFSDENHIRSILKVEVELARAQAALGMIPEEAAKEIESVLPGLNINPADLTNNVGLNGVMTIPLLKIVKEQLSEENRDYLHYGSTSQDIIDTAFVLNAKNANQILLSRSKKLIKKLAQHAKTHQEVITVSRTRNQKALPNLYALKVANWIQPLLRNLERLSELEMRLYQIQFGAAGGTLGSYQGRGLELGQHLADGLGLNYTKNHWQNQRDNITEYAAWLANVSGCIGKIAGDFIFMAQTEVGEFIENGSGGDSTAMPHKNNPVLSEAIISLSKYNAGLLAMINTSMLHQNERDGSAWTLEWLSLPQMIVATGTCLRHALSILETCSINTSKMWSNEDTNYGLHMSEAAKFILEPKVGISKAAEIVKNACQVSLENRTHIVAALFSLTPNLDIEWETELKPQNYVGSAKDIIENVLSWADQLK